MEWDVALTELRMHLKLERSLSDRTVEAYLRDLGKLRQYAEQLHPPLSPTAVTLEDLQHFLTHAHDVQLAMIRAESARIRERIAKPTR